MQEAPPRICAVREEENARPLTLLLFKVTACRIRKFQPLAPPMADNCHPRIFTRLLYFPTNRKNIFKDALQSHKTSTYNGFKRAIDVVHYCDVHCEIDLHLENHRDVA